MAKAIVHDGATGDQPAAKPARSAAKLPPEQSPLPETFSFTLPNGDILTVGRPHGILKLKLREILTTEQLADNELKMMVTSALSVHAINNEPFQIRNYNGFEAFLNRFGSDENHDRFMEHYLRFTQPEQAQLIETIHAEAIANKVPTKDIAEYVQRRVYEEQQSEYAKLRD